MNVNALGDGMIAAARTALAARKPALQEVSELELRWLATALGGISGLLATGTIDPGRAQLLTGFHELTMRSVLRSIEGLGILAADQTLQAVLGVAGGAVNRVVGFRLL
jgi:hypothetical protein